MREGDSGSSSSEGERKYPSDTKYYKTVGSWELYTSKVKKYLIIDTNDYHPGLLYLTKKDLEKIIEGIND